MRVRKCRATGKFAGCCLMKMGHLESTHPGKLWAGTFACRLPHAQCPWDAPPPPATYNPPPGRPPNRIPPPGSEVGGLSNEAQTLLGPLGAHRSVSHSCWRLVNSSEYFAGRAANGSPHDMRGIRRLQTGFKLSGLSWWVGTVGATDRNRLKLLKS